MLNFRMVYQYLNLSLKSHLYLESYRLVCRKKKSWFCSSESSVFHLFLSLAQMNPTRINLMLYFFQAVEEEEEYKPVFRS